MSLYLRVLGGARLVGLEGPVSGRAAHKRRLALLTILASARGRPVSRERIIGLLWPDSPGQAGRHLLSESLSVLRRELGVDLFNATGDELSLAAGVLACDLNDFEDALSEGRFSDAASIYAGPFLDGFVVSDAPDFERWADAERDRVGRAAGRSLEAAAEACEAARDHRGAAEWWLRLAELDQYSSRVAIRLMRALEAAGERAAAVRRGEVHAAMLRADLEIAPPGEFLDLLSSLRSAAVATPAQRVPSPQVSPPEPAPPPEPAGTLLLADVVGCLPMRRKHPAAAAQVIEALHASATEVVEGFGGRVVEWIDDAALAEFPGELAAVRAGLSLSEQFNRSTLMLGLPTELRVGVHRGRLGVAADGSYYGEALTAATQLQEEAAPGRIFVSEAVRQALPPGEFGFIQRGWRTLAGHAVPTPVYEVAAAPGVGPDRPPRLERSRVPRFAVAIAVVVVLASSWAVRSTNTPVAAPNTLDPNRIVVLPFRDISADQSLGYLAEGLAEHLVGELSSVPALSVVSQSAVRHYAVSGVSQDSLARALGAGSLVEASLQHASDSVRVVIRLLDGERASVVRSETLQFPEESLFRMETELSQLLARFLRSRLGDRIQLHTAAATRSEEAGRLFLQGRQARRDAARILLAPDPLDAAGAFRILDRADALFAAASARDPAWTKPTIARGWVAMDRASRTPDRTAEFSAAATAFAEDALARAPADPEALELRGAGRFNQALLAKTEEEIEALADSAEADFRRSGSATSLSRLSQLLRVRARYAESVLAAEQAHEADAYLISESDIVDRRFRAALLLARYEEARAHCQRGFLQYPGDVRFMECHLNLLARDGSTPPVPDSAWALVAALDRLQPPAQAWATGRGYSPIFRRMMAAAVLARAGQKDSARAVVARARGDANRDPEVARSLRYDESWVSHLIADDRQAVLALERYLGERPVHAAQVRRDPMFTWALPAAAPRRHP